MRWKLAGALGCVITGIVPAMGELVILTPRAGGDARVAGRLGPAAFSGN